MWQQPYAMQFSMNFLDENAYEVRIYDREAVRQQPLRQLPTCF